MNLQVGNLVGFFDGDGVGSLVGGGNATGGGVGAGPQVPQVSVVVVENSPPEAATSPS